MKIIRNYFRRRQPSDSALELSTSVIAITQGAADIWAKLPDSIREDSSLALLRLEYERVHGTCTVKGGQGSSTEENISEDMMDDVFVTVDLSESKNPQKPANKSFKMLNTLKIAILVLLWVLFTAILMFKDEKVLKHRHLAIPVDENKSYVIDDEPLEPRFSVILYGAFAAESANSSNYLYLQVRLAHDHVDEALNHANLSFIKYHNDIIEIPIIENIDEIDTAIEVKRSYTFQLDPDMFTQIGWTDTVLSLEFATDLPITFPVNVVYDSSPIDKSLGVIYAAIILIGLYAMIISEIIDRTFAAMIASTLSISVLALMNERPTLPEITSWLDVETLLLLFGMMVLVGILSETGLFDYLAVYAFKITKGNIWALIYCLCLFTEILSAILDNVTTLLLIAPVCIRLCDVIKLNPVPILISMVLYSNIGAVTPVGDPPNIMIAVNPHVIKSGVNFLNFTLHMSIGAIFVMAQAYFQLRLKYRTINDLRETEPQEIQELRSDIAAWQKAASNLSYTKDADIVREMLSRKIERLQQQLKYKLAVDHIPSDVYRRTLQELQDKYPIRDMALLIKSAIALTFVFCCFFLHSLPFIEKISLGWAALLAAVLLLILADRRDIDAVLAHVEWSTLLIFASLFVLMESLTKLGLIDWIGAQTEAVILSVNEESRLAVAILIILWVSGLGSAFVNNIPLTTMMIKLIISLTEKESLDLPLQPLVWALAIGACLGGNGTLIGASANIVTAGIAEQHGHRISFMDYFKIAFPVTIGSLIVASAYLLICHVCFTWH